MSVDYHVPVLSYALTIYYIILFHSPPCWTFRCRYPICTTIRFDWYTIKFWRQMEDKVVNQEFKILQVVFGLISF